VADPAPHRASDSSDSAHQREALVETAELLAKILDTSIKIPGTPLSVGLDPLLGLIPGVGDIFSIWFKSHARNAQLLRRAAGQPYRETWQAWLYMVCIIGGTVMLLLLTIGAVLWIVIHLWNAIAQ